MPRIELLIKAIDKEILSKGKNYISLGQANKMLYENGHITESEKKNGFLKSLLESGEFKKAKQTETSPKQWRIFLSDKRLKPKPKKTPIQNKAKPIEEYNIPQNHNSNNSNLWKWIIGGLIAIIFIYTQLADDDYSNQSKYSITSETYVATSKNNFDEMFSYIASNDTYALNLMILDGQVRILKKGMQVELVENHFSYSVVREQGSRDNYWVVTEHIGR